MGADIHIFPEIGQESKYYQTLGELRPGRSYVLFSRIAGVRGGTDPVVPCRGKPDRFYYGEEDYHRWTWLTVEEFERALTLAEGDLSREDWYCEELDSNPYPDYWAIVAMCIALQDSGYDVRLVIAFDS